MYPTPIFLTYVFLTLPVSLAPCPGSAVDRHVTMGKDCLMGLFFSICPCGLRHSIEDSVGAL